MASTTIQMDPVSANRFVSSLSKSLQALCHGCMDFDTQIEIVGFINLNIDCLGKVDYVLNEKVSKGSDNSMSFMSHSYLAKKDEPKTLKERSCSPIPELNIPNTSYQTQRRDSLSSYQNTQHYRSSAIFSPHSQVVRGSQKRPRGNWRVQNRATKSPRTQQYESSFDNNQNFDQSSSFSSAESQANPGTSYSQPSTSQQEYNYENTPQPHIQLKTEAPDESGDTNNQNFSSQTKTNANSAQSTDINIKSDPDFPDTNTQQASDSSTQQCTNQSSAGYSESGQGTNESFLKTEYDASGSQNADDTATSHMQSETGGDGAQAEGQSYDASFYGEESGEASEFDVIEIDDEDEDEHLAQFNDLQLQNSKHLRKDSSKSFKQHQLAAGSSTTSSTPTSSDHANRSLASVEEMESWSNSKELQPNGFNPSAGYINIATNACTFCESPGVLTTKSDHQRHINECHKDEMLLPWICSVCKLGFFTNSGLYLHKQRHSGISFRCPLCDQCFAQNHSVKYHLLSKHKKKHCLSCETTYPAQGNVPHVCNRM